MKKIMFEPEDIDKGFSIILHNGTVVYTGQRGIYIVPDKSVEKLRKLKIKFRILDSQK